MALDATSLAVGILRILDTIEELAQQAEGEELVHLLALRREAQARAERMRAMMRPAAEVPTQPTHPAAMEPIDTPPPRSSVTLPRGVPVVIAPPPAAPGEPASPTEPATAPVSSPEPENT